MKLSHFLLGATILAGLSSPALADPPSFIWNRVSVCDPSNPLNCLKPSSGGLTPVSQPDVRGTGTIAAATPNAAYAIPINNGEGVASFAVTGLTGTGATLTIEASDDGGTTWAAVNGIAPATGALFSTLTTNQQFRVNSGGRTNLRLRVSSAGTGTISVASNAASASSAVALSSPLPAGTNALGSVLTPITGVATNPTATLALPSTTSAYTAGWLICSSATVATCNSAIAANPLAIANTAGAVIIPRLRLSTNDATSTAWATQTITVDLWSAAPTFQTTGDRASFATDLLTGTGSHLGAFTCTFPAAAANSDGLYAECAPSVGNFATVKLASGTSIFWTLTATTGSGVTGASKTFTLTAETLN